MVFDGLMTGPKTGRLGGASVDEQPGELPCELLDRCMTIGRAGDDGGVFVAARGAWPGG